MKAGWPAIAVLLAAVAVLGGIAYFKPRGDAGPGGALSTLRPADAKHIRIERGGAQIAALEKREQRWRIVEPLEADADAFHVGRLLAILDARPANRLAAERLERFDLAPPKANLIIDGQVFGFGAINAVTREQYVLNGGVVHAVVLNYGAALPAHVYQLVSKQLLAPGEIPVRFALAGFTLEKQDGAWRLTPPAEAAGQDDINRWVDGWQYALAMRAQAHDGRKPLEQVTIGLNGGTEVGIGILQREPEFILARPDRKLQYAFTAEAGKRLLAMPGIAAGARR